jgi:hypothetical protein
LEETLPLGQLGPHLLTHLQGPDAKGEDDAGAQRPPRQRTPGRGCAEAPVEDEAGDGCHAAAVELGLVDELRMFRDPVVMGGGTPFLPPVTEDVPLDLIETRTFGSRVVYERYRRVRDGSD